MLRPPPRSNHKRNAVLLVCLGVVIGLILAKCFAPAPSLNLPPSTPFAYKERFYRPPGTKATPLWSSPWVRMEMHDVSAGDGRGGRLDWLWLDSPDMINIVVETADKKEVVLFKQTKYGMTGDSFAPVGGYVEDGETFLEAAKRELLEELDMVATTWVPLGEFRTDVNRGMGTLGAFLARGATRATEHAVSDDLEKQETVYKSWEELTRIVLDNVDVKEVKWMATFAAALAYINHGRE